MMTLLTTILYRVVGLSKLNGGSSVLRKPLLISVRSAVVYRLRETQNEIATSIAHRIISLLLLVFLLLLVASLFGYLFHHQFWKLQLGVSISLTTQVFVYFFSVQRNSFQTNFCMNCLSQWQICAEQSLRLGS